MRENRRPGGHSCLDLCGWGGCEVGETPSVDAQVQWLTNPTSMFQLPGIEEVPRSDRWAADFDRSEPRLLVH